MWLRGGNTSSATNFLGFLEDTLSKLKNKTVSLISDCGSFHSFPETSLEENVSFFGCRQGDHAAAKKMVKTNNGKNVDSLYGLIKGSILKVDIVGENTKRRRLMVVALFIPSQKRLPKKTFRFLAAGQEITQRRKN